jgi:hypothetical protein
MAHHRLHLLLFVLTAQTAFAPAISVEPDYADVPVAVAFRCASPAKWISVESNRRGQKIITNWPDAGDYQQDKKVKCAYYELQRQLISRWDRLNPRIKSENQSVLAVRRRENGYNIDGWQQDFLGNWTQ